MKAQFTKKQESSNVYSFVAYAMPDPEPEPEPEPPKSLKTQASGTDDAKEDIIAGLLESTDVIEVARRKAQEAVEGPGVASGAGDEVSEADEEMIMGLLESTDVIEVAKRKALEIVAE